MKNFFGGIAVLFFGIILPIAVLVISFKTGLFITGWLWFLLGKLF